MNKPRKTVEQIKQEFRQQIYNDADKYKRSIIREIETQYRLNTGATLPQVQDKVLKQLKVSASFKQQLIQEINSTDKEISSVWKDYFKKLSRKEFIPADYEKLVSAAKVNFNTLDVTLNSALKKEFTKAISGEFNFETLISNIKKHDVGDAQAYTLANTSVAQFDNAYHSESAQQAGIEKFLYDGDISDNTREFCEDHCGHVYTLDELDAMDNHQGLPVLYNLGGYNCQHFLTAVV
jgi:hypothetical protein